MSLWADSCGVPPAAASAEAAAGVLASGPLPPGCRNCLAGRGACVSVTTRCTRDCFFCPNPTPRRDGLLMDSRAFDEEGLLERAAALKLEGLGISGGEPLLRPRLVLRLLSRLRERFGRGFRLHLYTNGDLATPSLLRSLARAGLDEIRFDLAANGYDAAPVRRAAGVVPAVGVEAPILPGLRRTQERLALELDAAGASFWTAQELYASRENAAALARRGYRRLPASPLVWPRVPVRGSAEAARSLVAFAAGRCRILSVYFCSWAVKERLVAPASYAWRLAAEAA